MSDPSLGLQKAIFAALSASAGVTAAGSPPIGSRIYDKVPKDPVFPYLVIGDDQIIGDDDGCGENSEAFVRIHVWSRAVGFPEVKTIAGAVRAAIIAATFAIAGFEVVVVQFVQAQFIPDPDPLTRHAVVEFRFLISHT